MNKTAIKNFAVWARQKLIADITYKAGTVGIKENGIAEKLPQSTSDTYFYDVGTKEYAEVSGNAIKQRDALVKAIREKEKDCGKYKEAFEFVVEEVAYTWFNRLVAIRFMEVNNYLPSGIRVLSSENKAKVEPDFVTTPFDTDLEFTPFEQDHIIELKDKNKLDELFRMLFIKQCNKLHEILPELFEKTDDYTELLLTISFTDKDGVVYQLTHDVDEDDFNIEKEGQVEIIGWMYQFYNSVPKDTVFANLKKNKKIRKEDIPAATQLFTPDWIVRYMVENSLGRLWVEGHPNKELKKSWKYYLEEAPQEESVEKQLEEIRRDYSAISPENIKLIDPCMGSGHILVYAFDVLMQIYDTMGYTARDAVRNIVENNIYGLDIDKRAAQLSYFAMMMKARQYDRRFFGRNIQPNVYAIRESNGLDQYAIDYFCKGDSKLIKAISSITAEMHDAKEYGSIIDVTSVDFEALYARFEEIEDDINMSREVVLNELLPLVQVAEVMAQKYDVACTNPPYMGKKSLNGKLSDFLDKNYADEKSELYSAFIVKCLNFTKHRGFTSMITIHTWMFIASFEKLRSKVLNETTITSMVHTGAATFEELNSFNVLATSFSLRKAHLDNYKGSYLRLSDFYSTDEKLRNFRNDEQIFNVDQTEFYQIPGNPLVYWISEDALNVFEKNKTLKYIAEPRVGLQTGDNNRFVRFWFEVENYKMSFSSKSREEAGISECKWFPYNKGGNFRKWYGMNEYVVNWENDGYELRNYKSAVLRNPSFYFKPGITWSLFGFENFGVRYKTNGFLFDVSGSSMFPSDDLMYYILAFLCSKVAFMYLSILAPTVNFQVGNIGDLPLIVDKDIKEEIDDLSKECIKMAKADWDDFEESWDFEKHPLLRYNSSKTEESFNQWVHDSSERYSTLKKNEERINTLFIKTYNLKNDVTPEVVARDIAMRIADKTRDIQSLISYAVGCMFGRYSLDEDGLAYAGGEWDNSKYDTFIPDEDNCIPITDEEYFEDDIVGLFCAWLKKVYGEDTLEENLDFIANALGNKGKTSREVIRNYFLTDFIKDHIKTYQKRPIYWLFDSGKQNGFKALVYMHRWNADTIGNVRVEYLHRIQRVYEKEIIRMQEIIDNSHDNKEISNATKRKEKLQKQIKETKDYDAKIAHLALSRIDINLDDGVKVNYEKVQTADGKKMQILAKI